MIFIKRELKYILSFISIFITFLMITYLYYTININNYLSEVTKKYQRDKIQAITNMHNYSNLVYDLLINTPETKAILRQSLDTNQSVLEPSREQLYQHLIKQYRNLQNINIYQLHFHTQESTSFLRMHKRNYNGDSLVGVREMVVFVNKYHQPISGFEGGRVVDAYRFIYPLFDEQGYLGSVEISQSFGGLLTLLTDSNRFAELLIKKEVVDTKVFSKYRSNYKVSKIDPNFYTIHTQKEPSFISDKVHYAQDSHLNEAMQKMEIFSDYYLLDGNYYTLTLLPLANPISKKKVAYITIFSKSEYIKQTVYFFYMQIFFAFVIAGVIVLLWRRSKSLHLQVLEIMLDTEKLLKKEARYDNLLEIYNRNHINKMIHALSKRQNDVQKSLIMLDIDDFKQINDNYSHGTGDAALIEFAKITKQLIRQDDLLSRWGGDEFMILFNGNREAAINVAEKIRSNIETHAQESLAIPPMTTSIGVVGISEYESIHDALEAVDQKLYQAKKEGKNRVAY